MSETSSVSSEVPYKYGVVSFGGDVCSFDVFALDCPLADSENIHQRVREEENLFDGMIVHCATITRPLPDDVNITDRCSFPTSRCNRQICCCSNGSDIANEHRLPVANVTVGCVVNDNFA